MTEWIKRHSFKIKLFFFNCFNLTTAMKGLVTSKSGYAKLCCSNKLKFQWCLHNTIYTGFMPVVHKAQQGFTCLPVTWDPSQKLHDQSGKEKARWPTYGAKCFCTEVTHTTSIQNSLARARQQLKSDFRRKEESHLWPEWCWSRASIITLVHRTWCKILSICVLQLPQFLPTPLSPKAPPT